MPIQAGAQFDHYEIRLKIGAGGMGEVYLAQDVKLDRKVALKILHAEVANDPRRIQRLTQEAQAASALNHPNILTIYEIGESGGVHFIATEYVEGITLRDRAKSPEPLKLAELVDIGAQTASALAAAHAAGIVHRDIKPDNLMLRKDGLVKVLDFGLAKLTALSGSESNSEAETRTAVNTEPGTVMGTVAYMSPEQARGGTVDHRSDIFSFGAVLYEMASGRMAFPGSTAEAFAAILARDPAPVGDARLDAVIRRALRKNPAERYQSASELKAALEALQQTAAPLSRRKLLYAAGGVAAAGTAAVATRLLWTSSGAANLRTFAVMMIENLTGDPSLDWMDRGLCELLTTALAQSQALAVLSTEMVRSAAARRFRDSAKLTVEHTRDVARDANAELYASGTLLKLSPGFRLNLRAQETQSGRLVYTGAVDGADAQALFGMTDQAAAAMLAQVAPRAQAKPDSAGGLTSNLEALKAYTEANIYMDQFLLGRAAEQFGRAVDLDPDFALAYVGLANIAWSDSNRPAARAAAARAVAISQRRRLPVAQASHIQSMALMVDGRWEELLKTLEAARKEAPKDRETCNFLLTTYMNLGRYPEAIWTLEEAARLDPNAAETYMEGAYVYAESGDLPKALQFIERYASLVPPNTYNVVESRGDIFACNEHFDQALEQYRIAAKIQPTNQVGRLLAILGRIEEAEAHLESLPENRRPREVYCDILTRKGNLVGALASYEELMRRNTNRMSWSHFPHTWNAGNILLEQRDVGQALALGKRLPNPWAPGLRGAAHLILGDEGAAQADFAELRKGIEPIVGDFMARTTESLWRIRAASYMGRHGEVADLCSRLTRADDVRWTYSLDLVRALLALGRLVDAEAELTWLIRRMLDLGVGAPVFERFSMFTYLLARYHLAQVREKTGRRTEAADWYRYFLSSFEHSAAKLPQIAEARAALKRF